MKDIIKYAEKNGYRGHLKFFPRALYREPPHYSLKILEGYQSDIFFDHDFCKAVFGDAWALQGANIFLQEPDKRKEYVKSFIGEKPDEATKD